MNFRRFIIGIRKLIRDSYCLMRPNKLFIYGLVSREGVDYDHFNWGDDINIWMIEEISNLKVLVINKSKLFHLFARKVYSCIGSILGMCYGRGLVVWGSGFISEQAIMKVVPNRICSVRGPLTRQKLLDSGIECPEIYGDPSLLVSRYYHPKVKKQYKYGIIPHYVDENNPIIQALKEREDVLIISMSNYRHWHDIPDAVCSCEKVISSSLHGLIVSDSYGIPNVWIRLSDKVYGGNFKFQDYFKSVNRDINEPVIIDNIKDILTVFSNDSLYTCAKEIDFKSIYEACPFKQSLQSF